MKSDQETFLAVNLCDLTTIPPFIVQCLFSNLEREAVIFSDKRWDESYIVYRAEKTQAEAIAKLLKTERFRSVRAGAGIRTKFLTQRIIENHLRNSKTERELTEKFKRLGLQTMLERKLRSPERLKLTRGG